MRRQRILLSPHRGQNLPQTDLIPRHLRLQFRRATHHFQRLRRLSALQIRHAQQMQCLGVVRFGVENLKVKRRASLSRPAR